MLISIFEGRARKGHRCHEQCAESGFLMESIIYFESQNKKAESQKSQRVILA
jgi:hypothetical protein